MAEEPLTRCEFDADNLILRLDETVPATFEAIGKLMKQIMATVKSMGCAAGREHDVQVAIAEALTNAVVHGCENDPGKTVQCCVACDKDQGMLIIVRDPGSGFDPASVPSPTRGENLFATHGRGVFFINEMVDEVRYEKGGTEIHMRFDSEGKAST